MVEASVGDGGVKVHKVVCAVDCGVPINPDNIRAQMEGGIGFGLGAILAEELTLTGGVVDQANYDTYTPLRIDAMPEVEVHIVPSIERPTGVGEPGVPPIGPAVANAIYAATAKRVRQLPIAKACQGRDQCDQRSPKPGWSRRSVALQGIAAVQLALDSPASTLAGDAAIVP